MKVWAPNRSARSVRVPTASLGEESCDMRAQFGDAIAGPGGRQDHLWIGGDVLAQALERRRDACALVGGFHFVALGQHDRVGDGGRVEPAHRLVIALFEAVPTVDEHEYAQERGTAAQIVAREFTPRL